MREGHTEEPAEGSREVIDRELERRREREHNKVDHLPGVKVSGQPQGGAVDRAEREQRIRTRAHRMWEENGRPEKSDMRGCEFVVPVLLDRPRRLGVVHSL